MTVNIYLDIDGVILANDHQPAKYADEFIKYIVGHHTVYWLTTHCRQRENYTIPLLTRFFTKETMEYLKKIKPTYWNMFKTEVIDFSQPFLWFEDDLFEEEKNELMKHNVFDNWIQVDLRKNENILGTYLASFPISIQEIHNNEK